MNSIVKVLKNTAFLPLFPISYTWEKIYQIRRFAYKTEIIKSHEFEVPVISIGNLTFGGTGKTPFTMWISRFFNDLDKKVVILTRGYKGKLEHKSGIIRSSNKFGHNPFEYGDEPLLMARRLDKTSIIVGKRRADNLKYYFNKERPDIVLLDDGHQHLKIKRSLNIVLFDCLIPMKSYKVAPLGYMREGMGALADADVIIMGRSDQVPTKKVDLLKEELKKYSSKDCIFAKIGYRPTGLYNGNFEKSLEIEDLKGKNVICIAGIASPISFFNMVEKLGAKIVRKVAYPDHYYFTKSEIENLLKDAKDQDALLVTTEKDIVKIRRYSVDNSIQYIEIDIDFYENEDSVKELIMKVMK